MLDQEPYYPISLKEGIQDKKDLEKGVRTSCIICKRTMGLYSTGSLELTEHIGLTKAGFFSKNKRFCSYLCLFIHVETFITQKGNWVEVSKKLAIVKDGKKHILKRIEVNRNDKEK